jgi:phage/plasmid-like protein (TIGR03299 family)
MPAYFDQGFMVREPAWHGLGIVLEDYPGRETAMELAGHNFTVIERPVEVVGKVRNKVADGWKALVKSGSGEILQIVKDSYGVVQNDACWDIVDAIVDVPEVKYETGITMKGGAVCSVLAWLDEPVTIPGDDSPLLPFLNVSWSHDGSSAVSARSTSIRVVCWNTQSMAEAEGKRHGTDFTFRHTKNVNNRIAEARTAIQGMRSAHAEYVELARELGRQPVTREQRELFIAAFLPMPEEALISDRVKANVEEGRAAVRRLFEGPTIPEAHSLTAYGLHLAGVEYLDHLRGARNAETKYGRSLLRNEPAKVKLGKLIREVIAA